PPKLLISISTPWRLKMPVRAPISAGTKENASRPALPTRSVSAEFAGAVGARMRAAKARVSQSRDGSMTGHAVFAGDGRLIPSPLAVRFLAPILELLARVQSRRGRC